MSAIGGRAVQQLAEVTLGSQGLEEYVIESQTVVHAPEGATKLPGDCNGDDTIDVSDPVCLLGHLFLGSPSELGCGDGGIDNPANVELLDFNGDGRADLSDGIAQLDFLFAGGPPHALSTKPVVIAGCVGSSL